MRDKLLEFLRQHQVVNLAITDAAGHPYVAALFYTVDDDLHLYVVSDPRTRHGGAMLNDGRVAGTVQRDRQAWQEARGLQFTGRCTRLTGVDYLRGWAVYVRRFEFVDAPDLIAALHKVDLWRITPEWIRLIDNSVRFAFKEEWVRDPVPPPSA